MATLETRYGSGKHLVDVPFADLMPSDQLLYGTLISYQASLCFVKLSISLLYLRVFATSIVNKYTLYGIIAFNVILTISVECVSIFQCSPVAGVWNPSIRSICINTVPAFYTSAVGNMIIDFFLISFAVPQILALQMAPREKGALLITVGLGAIPIIAAIVRCVRIAAILHSNDQTWRSYDTSIWSAVDLNVSVVCASAPALKPLLRKIAPSFMGSTFGNSKPGQSNTYATGRFWTTNNDTRGGYELRSAAAHGLPRSQSQTELAYTGVNEWSTNNKDDGISTELDGISDEDNSLNGDAGIVKHTQVTISSVPS